VQSLKTHGLFLVVASYFPFSLFGLPSLDTLSRKYELFKAFIVIPLFQIQYSSNFYTNSDIVVGYVVYTSYKKNEEKKDEREKLMERRRRIYIYIYIYIYFWVLCGTW
jgi:hypothetical protein